MHRTFGKKNQPTKKEHGDEDNLIEKLEGEIIEAMEFAEDFLGGAKDFWDTYNEMKEAIWKKSDQYFHMKANFKATLRGKGGKLFAEQFRYFMKFPDDFRPPGLPSKY